jgi:hypothetical protein
MKTPPEKGGVFCGVLLLSGAALGNPAAFRWQASG